GAYTVINVHCLKVNNTSYFATDELWVADSTGSYWTEEGMAYGAPRTDRYWFWADQRPGHPYSEHDRPDLPHALDTDYSATIEYAGTDGNWNVYQNDGTPIGTSTSNFSPPSGWLDAGSESTAATQHVDAKVKSLLWKGTNDAWNTGWGGLYPSTLQSQDGYTTTWITQYQSAHITANTGGC